ncbi:MAG: hypothetical protein QHC65_04260 [Sphingomonas sp.]|nr:hypothetical protein [Sphingomonas sp.]MDX3883612.1 hypothetical protein [Sphingomonas sp.]
MINFLLMQAAVAVAPAPVMAVAPVAAPANVATLPSGTEVSLRLNEVLTTKSAREGDTFNLTLTHDVMLAGYVAIPRGTRGVGEVTWKTGKGMLGKSGKLEIALRYLDLNGRRIPLDGKYRHEGSGNTVATVGSVVLLWPAAPFITGKSGVIPEGREFIAHTVETLAVALPGPPIATTIAAAAAAPVTATAAASTTPPVTTPGAAPAKD